MLLALLSVYMVSAVRLNALHELLHDDTHAAVTHLDEDESDGCHRAIYHNDKQGCGHKTHIVQHSDCQTCDFIANADIVLSAGKTTEQQADLSLNITHYLRVSPDTQSSLPTARGPPFC